MKYVSLEPDERCMAKFRRKERVSVLLRGSCARALGRSGAVSDPKLRGILVNYIRECDEMADELETNPEFIDLEVDVCD